MDNLVTVLYNIRGQVAEVQQGLKAGLEWYKQEMDNLKQQLMAKDKEIEELKKKVK